MFTVGASSVMYCEALIYTRVAASMEMPAALSSLSANESPATLRVYRKSRYWLSPAPPLPSLSRRSPPAR